MNYVTLHLFFEELGWIEVYCVEVEECYICPLFDVHIGSSEAYTGWWDVWAIGGDRTDLVAVFTPDE